jgi:peptidoglycan hydrolase-like protein with peptidoglycan-binding domain
MGQGYLSVNLIWGDGVAPAPGTQVLVKDGDKVLYTLTTDENGKTAPVPLDVADLEREPGHGCARYNTYDVEVKSSRASGGVVVHGVQIFNGIESDLPITLHPPTRDGSSEEIVIPVEHGIDFRSAPETGAIPQEADYARGRAASNTVKFPAYITVHIGYYTDGGKNVTVPFRDYIKNVACSEICPNWHEAALYANIYCQISYALNRIYTIWYRSRGYSFDITNNTRTDQYYVEGREIFANVAAVADKIFDNYLKRYGRSEPYFSIYCNGTTSTCDGLSQWGSEYLAEEGYSAMDIIHYYYPKDMELAVASEISYNNDTYPGYLLAEGMDDGNVQILQDYLNRISADFPLIPKIPSPNGYFDSATKAAVKKFQEIFGLTADGLVGKSTWYEISRIYVAVKHLAELDSEGERIGIGKTPPTAWLTTGAKNEHVVELQFIINYISQFYNSIPSVVEDASYGQTTKDAVTAFQKAFGLSATGNVDAATWQKLYEVYWSLQESVPGNTEPTPPAPTPPVPTPPAPTPPTSGPEYPGYLLKQGQDGENIRLMQEYLNKLSTVYPSIPLLTADGKFGPATQQAVIAFQKLFGLSADGIIGKATWEKIVGEYQKIPSSSVPQYPGYLLKTGSSGDDVTILQTYLAAIAKVYPSIPALSADGQFGSGTAASVKEFQSLFGLSADGIVGKATWDKVVSVYQALPSTSAPQYSGYALSTGSSGDAVRLVQTYLNNLSASYPSIPWGTADGIFGNGTKNAVIAFQKLFGLTADGVVGKGTWNKLVSLNNVQSYLSTAPASAQAPAALSAAAPLAAQTFAASAAPAAAPEASATSTFDTTTLLAALLLMQAIGKK